MGWATEKRCSRAFAAAISASSSSVSSLLHHELLQRGLHVTRPVVVKVVVLRAVVRLAHLVLRAIILVLAHSALHPLRSREIDEI